MARLAPLLIVLLLVTVPASAQIEQCTRYKALIDAVVTGRTRRLQRR